MNKHYDKEFLYHSLPDFILSKISDQDLISEIKSEIENNPEFKNEYDEMLGAFKFLDSSELDAPDESYFNNLSVKINDRIYKEKIPVNFLERLGLLWKLLIPASLVIIAAFTIFNLFINNKEELTQNENKTIYNSNDNIENKDKENKIDTIAQNKLLTDLENLRKDKSNNTLPESFNYKNSVKRKHNTDYEKNQTAVANDLLLIGENKVDLGLLAYNINSLDNQESELDAVEDILFFKNSDEDDSDEELLDLTPEEEKEILEHL
jgi:hypothetical protein